jgi:hypothetical protein
VAPFTDIGLDDDRGFQAVAGGLRDALSF